MGTHTTTHFRAHALDFLRISLCAGVVLYHYTPDRPCIGPFMVIGFLVLSGFLLGLNFAQHNILDPTRFYAHKCKRFLPMLTAVLFILFCLRLLLGHELVPPPNFEYGNFSIPLFLEWYNIPTWYMGVELLLLLAAPFFFFLHQSKGGIPTVCVGAALFSYFLFSRVPYEAPFGDGLYFSPIARCWQFMAGILSAQILTGKYRSLAAHLPHFNIGSRTASARQGG